MPASLVPPSSLLLLALADSRLHVTKEIGVSASPTSNHRTKALQAKTARLRTSTGKAPRKKANKTAKSSREKVRAYRERMRKRGMKLIQIWVPDPRSPYFAAEARRQARLANRSPFAAEDQAWVDSMSDWKPD
jgi:hypothetical protein